MFLWHFPRLYSALRIVLALLYDTRILGELLAAELIKLRVFCAQIIDTAKFRVLVTARVICKGIVHEEVTELEYRLIQLALGNVPADEDYSTVKADEDAALLRHQQIVKQIDRYLYLVFAAVLLKQLIKPEPHAPPARRLVIDAAYGIDKFKFAIRVTVNMAYRRCRNEGYPDRPQRSAVLLWLYAIFLKHPLRCLVGYILFQRPCIECGPRAYPDRR